uniref:Uncharacterized protein n=1 Tax=Siphoviridae sp. ct6bb17 TaxID=2825345 RepID=A0A8S5NZM0_9CAUD|nr:MAG TPA: hypothetical protein [Siphoviridae sp. ct6bb17]
MTSAECARGYKLETAKKNRNNRTLTIEYWLII